MLFLLLPYTLLLVLHFVLCFHVGMILILLLLYFLGNTIYLFSTTTLNTLSLLKVNTMKPKLDLNFSDTDNDYFELFFFHSICFVFYVDIKY